MEPNNGGFEDDVSFKQGDFQVPCYSAIHGNRGGSFPTKRQNKHDHAGGAIL